MKMQLHREISGLLSRKEAANNYWYNLISSLTISQVTVTTTYFYCKFFKNKTKFH